MQNMFVLFCLYSLSNSIRKPLHWAPSDQWISASLLLHQLFFPESLVASWPSLFPWPSFRPSLTPVGTCVPCVLSHPFDLQLCRLLLTPSKKPADTTVDAGSAGETGWGSLQLSHHLLSEPPRLDLNTLRSPRLISMYFSCIMWNWTARFSKLPQF